MNVFWALVLGILQGLTEFLPVSSSGHLVIAQSIIPGFSQAGVTFDVVLHAGTLLATVIYFRRKILKLDVRYLKLLFVATIPAVLFGLLFKDYIEALFTSTALVGAALLLTSFLDYKTDKNSSVKKNISLGSYILIGVAQAVAIIPGVSRSGSTIYTGTKAGLARDKAAEFSFLLSIPAVLGANFLEIFSHRTSLEFHLVYYIVGFTAAFVSGYFAIRLVITLLISKRFRIFSIYCFLLGIMTLLLL